ncbi:MAG: helix-turn-helix transcriptional regulator [Dehalococcoidia bacterium]|nr:helix-turn-helix transcriptional regulator [Dehalococcoidia bacterium]
MVKVRLNRNVVYQLLGRRNISQRGLAVSLGVSSGYLTQLLNGERCPSARLRQKMLQVMNPLTFDDLFLMEHQDARAREQTPGM